MNDNKNHHHMILEVIIRLTLGVIFLVLEYAEPFHRKIQPEEMWLYKNPKTFSYIPTRILWPIICIVPFFITFVTNLLNRNKVDGFQAFLALTLSFGINGLITNSVKLIVGRPRPDFFYRCFPDGKGDAQFMCTGKKEEIIEGLKSFPSGHSSFAFVSMTFCTLYLCGKLQIFNQRGRGQAWRVLLALSPMFAALVIALSRTCDYHHHWQDVLVGSVLGIVTAWLSYFQYYPPLSHPNCGIPYSILMNMSITENASSEQLKKSDSLENVSVKWI
ncbi:phospholipid phosphatase 5-like [Uloborus diversus]|uniref:phospholipid phosphatase 5-like n=1 Tax=Uloborus diversus TaxID=327109 RepID=UPI00240A5660|nr:phospholipid phosphatase 5-like [Uloborus diversus]